MHSDVESILFTEEQIAEAIKTIGKRITDDHTGKSPVIIGILKGSFVFMSDLVRSIELDCELDFMVAKSYGNAAVSSGTVNVLKDIDTDIAGKDVIIVEDILDTARTLAAVKEILSARKPASIQICTLLDKVTTKKVSVVRADYKCFDVGDEFVVGYGLDYAERYRNLRYIGILKREIYEH